MNTRLLICIMLFQLAINGLCQNLIFTSNFNFLGYKSNDPVFSLYSRNEDIDAIENGLYKIQKVEFDLFGFKLSEQLNKVKGTIFFVKDAIAATHEYNVQQKARWIRIYNENSVLDSVLTEYEFYSAYSEKNKILFLSTSVKEFSKIAFFDFNDPNPVIKYLPLHGRQLYLIDDYLYFSYDRRNYGYSPYLDDIFRVKIGDWNNPELILKGSEIRDWFVFPTGDVIYIRTDLGKGKREIDMLFNIMTNTYAELGRVGFKYPAYLSLDNIDYFIKSKKIKGIKSLYLVPLPKLPTSYPYKDTRRILPREVWYNLPLIEKIFNGTFITPGLLRGAPREELEKLEKSQLRLLRNAIYAQQAFIFQSKDLQDFFNQFEWYRMMTNKKTSNEDVVLLPEDEERANLILEIEQSK